MPNVAVRNADECARALEDALEAMVPPLDDVHGGILRLIAEFVPYVRFDTSRDDIKHFAISNEHTTATRRDTRRKYRRHFACPSPSFSDGVQELTFRIDKHTRSFNLALGVIPATAGADVYAVAFYSTAYVYYSDGYFWHGSTCAAFGTTYSVGDTITVRLDLDANTVAFRKNGASVGSPQRVSENVYPPYDDNDYYFVFSTCCNGDAASIVDDAERTEG